MQYLHVRTRQYLPTLLVHSCCCWASLCTSQVLWSVPAVTPETQEKYHNSTSSHRFSCLILEATSCSGIAGCLVMLHLFKPHTHLKGHLIFGYIGQDNEAFLLCLTRTEAQLLCRTKEIKGREEMIIK